MSRFRWLEMDGGRLPPENGPAGPARADADENTCLAEANERFRKGEYETALQWYSRALRYAVDLEEAWLGQARCLLNLGEDVEANIWAERALERFPNSADLLAAKALAVSRTRGSAEAMAYSDASLTVKGGTVGPWPWVVRGELLLDGGGSRQTAQRCFSQALAIGGGDWYTHFLVGRSYQAKGMLVEAMQRFLAGSKLEPGNVVLFCAVGECSERLGNVAAARDAYRRALNAEPRCKRAQQRLAELRHVGLLRRLWRRIGRRG